MAGSFSGGHAARDVAWSLHPYRLPLAQSYAWARGTHTERGGALVTVMGGWGEIAYAPDAGFDEPAVRQEVQALVQDTDASVSSRVRCGVATAHLDAAAREEGVQMAFRLAEAAGRTPRETVRVNALLTGDAEALARQATQAQEQGIDVLKLKLGADRAVDLERVAAVRAAAPRATIRLDANASWDAAWALAHMEELARFGIDYVEQPLPPDDQGLARLQGRGPFDVAIDESATSAAAVRTALRDGCARVAILKPQRLGGPWATLAAAEAAYEQGGRAIVTNSLETSVGVHAALHLAALLRDDEACGLATSRFFARDVAPVPDIESGRMALPRAPGLGIDPEVAQCVWP